MNSGDTAWMLISSGLVFLMTPAVAFFYGGMVRAKAVLHMMMLSVGAIAVVALAWAACGWSIAYAGKSWEVFSATHLLARSSTTSLL